MRLQSIIQVFESGEKAPATPCDLSVDERSSFSIYLASFSVKHAMLCTMRVGFTPGQVTRLTGVPYSTLNLWAKNGLIQPSIATGTGSGSERIYGFSDLVALRVAFELRKAGVTTRSLKQVVQFVRENEGIDKPLAEARLVVSGRDVLVVRNSNELVSALSRPGQSCLSFVMDLPRMLGQLTEIADATRAFAVGLAGPERVLKHPSKRTASIARSQRKRA